MFALLGIVSSIGFAIFTYRFFSSKKSGESDDKFLRLGISSGLLTLLFTFLDPHRVLAVLLLFAGLIAFVIAFVFLAINAAKQRPLKKVSTILLASFLVSIIAITAVATSRNAATPVDQGNDVALGPDTQVPFIPNYDEESTDPGNIVEDPDVEQEPQSGGNIPDEQDPQLSDNPSTPEPAPSHPQDPIQPEEPGQSEEPSIPDNNDTLSGTVAVHFIDVGQGDAILILTPSKIVLIDGGPRGAGATVVNYLNKQGVNSIDLIISTHPHEDHIGGLISVLGSFAVKEVIDPGVLHTTKTFEDYLDLIDAKNITFTEAKPGLTRDLGGTAQLQVIHPKSPSSSPLNDASVVTKLTFGNTSFLFAGDAEQASEQLMLSSSCLLASTVLKIGHHGSDTSTTRTFLEKVKPKHAIISCGAGNSFEYPRQSTLDKLKASNINTYRTDTHGSIVIKSDGSRVTASTTKSPSAEVVFTGADQPESKPEPKPEPKPGNGKFVGSKESDKYHWPDCRYANKILPENEVWFKDAKEALAAGYVPCGVCKPPKN